MTVLHPNAFLTWGHQIPVTNKWQAAFRSANNCQGQLQTLQSASVTTFEECHFSLGVKYSFSNSRFSLFVFGRSWVHLSSPKLVMLLIIFCFLSHSGKYSVLINACVCQTVLLFLEFLLKCCIHNFPSRVPRISASYICQCNTRVGILILATLL